MSAHLLRPGITFEVLLSQETGQTLHRTPSMYKYGVDLETLPSSGSYYIVCRDYSIQSVCDPKKPIGWEILEDDGEFFYRVTQHGFSPKKITLLFVGYDDDPPAGTGTIGSTVVCCKSQDAVIIDFEDDDEPEVTSRQQSNPFLSPSQ